MISTQTLDLFPFVRTYPIEDVLDWDLYGGSKLRWMLTDMTWDELHDEMFRTLLEHDWDAVDELGGERFLTSIRLVGSDLEVTIWDKEAQSLEDDQRDELLLEQDSEFLYDEP